MTNDPLTEMYNKLVDLSKTGDDVALKDFIQKEFKRLPDDVQRELITKLYFKSSEEEVEEARVLAQVQERAMEGIEAVEEAKRGLDK